MIFFTLLALTPLTAIPYGTVEEWWGALFECIILALAALWIIEGLISKSWLVGEHRLLLPLLVLFVFVLVQTIAFGSIEISGVKVWRTMSAAPYETKLVAFRFLALILAAAMLLRYTSSRLRLQALTYVVIGTGVASALFGIVRQVMHQDTRGFILPGLKPGLGYGQFINPDHFAFLMEMTLGLALGLVLGRSAHRQSSRGIVIYPAAALAVWTALVLSNSRGGILSMLGQALFLAILFSAVRSSRRSVEQSSGIRAGLQHFGKSFIGRALLIACLMVALIFAAIWMGRDPLVNRLATLPGEISAELPANRTDKRRIEYWQATLKLVKANPVVGVGFCRYWVAIDAYYDATGNSVPQQAHNDYLEIVASGGIIAVVLGAWFIVVVIKQARSCLRSRSSFRRAACLGALAGLFAVALHSFVDFGLHVTVNALVFTALIVIATVNVRIEKRASSSKTHQENLIEHAAFKIIPRLIARHRALRSAVAIIGVVACLAAMWTAGQAGLSRLFSHRAMKSNQLDLMSRAVRLTPSDPVANYIRAVALSGKSEFHESIEGLERAVTVRPGDYLLWLNLGFARYQNRDQQGGLSAFSEAVRLAPYYGQPRWQLGNSLLRAGQRDQAFTELRRAATSDPELLPSLIDLVWGEFGGDPRAVQQAILPQTTAERLVLARFFQKQGKLTEAFDLFRLAGPTTNEDRRELITHLLAAKRFSEAYEVWSSRREANSGEARGAIASITDGGFEGRLGIEPGFGWQPARDLGAVQVSLDPHERRSGAHSLRLEFNGDYPRSAAIISQLVLVEASARYRLNFVARIQIGAAGSLPGSLPAVVVIDADSQELLAQTALLPQGEDEWRDYSFEFANAGPTRVVSLAIRRQDCATAPCWLFGWVWFDEFTLEKMPEQ